MGLLEIEITFCIYRKAVLSKNDKHFNSNLSTIFLTITDLSNCQLIQVPDAVYFMMRDTQLNSCNLSSNVISRLTPKFPTSFLHITGNKRYQILSPHV